MQLAFGKQATISLTPIPLVSELVEGRRTFFSTGSEHTQPVAARVNAVLRSTFGKTFTSFTSAAARAEANAEKVEVAAFKDDESGAVRLVYREIIIRFEPKAPARTRKKLLEKYELEQRFKSAFALHKILAFDPKRKYKAERMLDLANELTGEEEVAFAFPNFVSEFRRDAIPVIPPAQWHLNTVKASTAWPITLGSNKITVAVLDDGIDIAHPNLRTRVRRNPDSDEPRDKFGRDFFVGEDAVDHFDPRPKRFMAPFDEMRGNDIHGTPCAGVVAAAARVSDIIGVARDCRILPVKVFHADDLATESQVADAIRYASKFASILSCSWSGPRSPDIEQALTNAATTGREGKGVPVFAAAGNGHPLDNFVSFPASSPNAIAVGASTDREDIASYSQRGPQVSIVAPSSGGARGIMTTDVSTLNRGFNIGTVAQGGTDGLHTNSFGGTSAATPLAAGIAALLLSVNPDLRRDEVKDILQRAADKIGPASEYDANGHSNTFGFGRINAAKAVEEAKAMRRQAGVARPASSRTAAKPAVRGQRKASRQKRS